MSKCEINIVPRECGGGNPVAILIRQPGGVFVQLICDISSWQVQDGNSGSLGGPLQHEDIAFLKSAIEKAINGDLQTDTIKPHSWRDRPSLL